MRAMARKTLKNSIVFYILLHQHPQLRVTITQRKQLHRIPVRKRRRMIVRQRKRPS